MNFSGTNLVKIDRCLVKVDRCLVKIVRCLVNVDRCNYDILCVVSIIPFDKKSHSEHETFVLVEYGVPFVSKLRFFSNVYE